MGKFPTFAIELHFTIGANNPRTLFKPIKRIARYGGGVETIRYLYARREV